MTQDKIKTLNNKKDNEIKILNADEDLNKFNEEKFINDRSDNNNTNINKKFDDISLIQTKEKKIVNEIEYNEMYSDNMENDDDIFEEELLGKSIKIPDLNIKSMSKFEEFLDNSIENIEIIPDNFTCKIIKLFFLIIFFNEI